VSLSNPILGHI